MNLSDLKAGAAAKGGECLADKSTGSNGTYEWSCSAGHTWFATANSVLNVGSWCPTCAGKEKLSLDDFQRAAEMRGGRCLSKAYSNIYSQLNWQCALGHQWSASADNIRNKQRWCPHCKTKGESYAREALEEATGKTFTKMRPHWLKGQSGLPLELDGFNDELGFAFEYQGNQHSEYTPHFHRHPNAFEAQKQRDNIKAARLREKAIFLIAIPEVPKPTKARVGEAVAEQCMQECLPLMINPEFKRFLATL